VIYEANIKPKEALNHYKKALKIKFNYFGENNDDVLDLQYKISSVYLTLRQYKEAEQIMTAMTDVVSKEKMNDKQTNLDNYYRYGVYFYTTGSILLKNGKNSLAKNFLKKAQALWKDIVNPNDPGLNSVRNLIKACEKKF
jgi:hypothetical protein